MKEGAAIPEVPVWLHVTSQTSLSRNCARDTTSPQRYCCEQGRRAPVHRVGALGRRHGGHGGMESEQQVATYTQGYG